MSGAEEPDDSDGEAGRLRKKVTVSPATLRYLEKLVDSGTHGATVATVMARLVEEGVRQAIREGFIRRLET